MAIAYQSTSVASGASSASVAAPSGCATGDFLIVIKVDRATSGTTTAPTDWTRQSSASAAGGRIEVFTGIYGKNSMTAGPWSFTGTTRTLARCERYTGVDNATPMDVACSVRSNASGTTGSATITAVTNGNMIVCGFATPGANYTWSVEAVATNPATLANEQESAYSTYADLAIVNALQTGSAGATGASSGTMSTAAANVGCIVSLRPAVAPTVTESAVDGIAADQATGHGNCTADGGNDVTERGVCWNTSGTPTTADSKTTSGTGTGTFAPTLSPLNPITGYHTRAYAINAIGTSYSSEQDFTSLDWAIRLGASANIAASAATDTTRQLDTPAGKTTGDFQAGKISDDTNPVTIDIVSGKWIELEFSIKAISGVAALNDIYKFRVTKAGTALDSYNSGTPLLTIGAGGVSVTPGAATSGASSTNPTTVLGALALTPAAAFAPASTVTPSVVLGAISLTPDAATAAAVKVDPTVDIGFPSVIVTPAASIAAASCVAPAVVLGALSLSPGAALSAASCTNPATVLGALSLSPVAAMAASVSIAPTLIMGSLGLAPSAAASKGASTDPAIVLSSLTLSPAAALSVATSVAPSLTLGSLSLGPSAAIAVALSIDPTVLAGTGVTVEPVAAASASSVTSPAVALSSMVVAPSASSSAATVVAPSVVLGSMTIAPAIAVGRVSSTDPTVLAHFDVAVSPAASSAAVAVLAPTVIRGSLALEPAASSASASVSAPDVILGSLILEIFAASARASSVDPDVWLGRLPRAVRTAWSMRGPGTAFELENSHTSIESKNARTPASLKGSRVSVALKKSKVIITRVT